MANVLRREFIASNERFKKINVLSFHFYDAGKEVQINPKVGMKMGHKPKHKSYDHKASRRKHRRISS